VFYAAVFEGKARTLVLAPIVLCATFGVAYRLLRATWPDGRRAAGHALVVALGVSEALWALTYWPIGGLAGGAALLLLCYALLGLLRGADSGSLDLRALRPYAAVGAVSLALVVGRALVVAR
jgi:hypothetical protein